MIIRSLNITMHRKKFSVPDEVYIADIKAALGKKFHCAEPVTRSIQRTFYDTFDWRMYNAGGIIEVESGASFSTMNWRDLERDAMVDSASIHQPIRFACELADCSLRKRIEPLLGMRALLPLVETQSKVHVLNVLNKDNKAIVRLVIEEIRRLTVCNSGDSKLPVTLSVEAVKGYKAFFHKVIHTLKRHFALKHYKKSTALSVYEVAGLHPGDHSASLDLQLAPDMRSDRVICFILLRLLEAMQVNEAGLKADLDSEFLHDFRVAVRRTRTILSQIRDVLPQQRQEWFRREFFWIGKITSPARDMDIFLINFITFKNSLPVPLKEDINPLHDFIKRRQKIEHVHLAKQLASIRYRKLIVDWHAFLKSPRPGGHCSLSTAMRPAIVVANKHIWRMYRRVVREGKLIQLDSPPEDLHELRISCKKLRYLMEYFFSLYPKNQIQRLIKALRPLQDQLGEHQDLQVQLTYLSICPAEIISDDIAGGRMLAAFDLIRQTIGQRQAKVRKLFKTRFTAFKDKKNREKFSKLFEPKLQRK